MGEQGGGPQGGSTPGLRADLHDKGGDKDVVVELGDYAWSHASHPHAQVFLRRISDDNRWVEIRLADTEGTRFGGSNKAGDVLLVGDVPVDGGRSYHPAAP